MSLLAVSCRRRALSFTEGCVHSWQQKSDSIAADNEKHGDLERDIAKPLPLFKHLTLGNVTVRNARTHENALPLRNDALHPAVTPYKVLTLSHTKPHI